jgi:hypothetical protein
MSCPTVSTRSRFAQLVSSATITVMVVESVSLGKNSCLMCSHSLTLGSFESREMCEEVIKKFNNTMVSKPGGEEYTIQIRYSDTHEQKLLKQQTAAARSFRAAEFEYGCIQAHRLGLLPSGSAERLSTLVANSANGMTNGNDFESYLQSQS